jgi:hypothetical protein
MGFFHEEKNGMARYEHLSICKQAMDLATNPETPSCATFV